MANKLKMTRNKMYLTVMAWAIVGIAIIIAIWITPAVLAWWERLVT